MSVLEDRTVGAIPVYLRCDAGGYHGFGHLARMQVLADYLFEHGSFSPVLIVHSDCQEKVRSKLFETRAEVVEAPAYLNNEEGWTYKFVYSRCVKDSNVPLLVFDQKDISPDFPAFFGNLGIIVCLDDEKYRNFDCDILVNPNPWAEKINYLASLYPERELLVGPCCHFLDVSYVKQRSIKRFGKERSRLLISMGGEDPHNHTSWILKVCASIISDTAVDIVIGPSHPNADQAKLDANQYAPHAHLHYSPTNLKGLVAGASVAITAGGQTCYELIAAGVPSIGIVVEEHQRSLVDFFVEEGALLYGGDYTFDQSEILAEALRVLLSSEEKWQAIRASGYYCFPSDGIAVLLRAIEQKIMGN